MIEPLIALVALSLMEIVLGIDNIVFISILTAKLPVTQQSAGRKWGLIMALGTRLALLSCIFWVVQLKEPIITLSDWLPIESLQVYFQEDSGEAEHEPVSRDNGDATGNNSQIQQAESVEGKLDQEAWHEFDGLSIRDLILLAGGLFLIYSSVHEIHVAVDGEHDEHSDKVKAAPIITGIVVRIAIMDIVFSLDSVITAVGMASQLWVMIVAVVIAVAVMIAFADQVGSFVDNNPTIRMLALSFLLLIGVMLVAEGIGTPISKGYIYFAMAFSLFVESFNLKIRQQAQAEGLRA